MKNILTDEEKTELRKYIDEMDILLSRRPPYDINTPQAWNSWTSQCSELNREYSYVLTKALSLTESEWPKDPQSIVVSIKDILTDNREEKNKIVCAQHTKPLSADKIGLMNDKINQVIICVPPEIHYIDGRENATWDVDQKKNGTKTPIISHVAMSSIRENDSIVASRKIDAKDMAVFTAAANIMFELKNRGMLPPYYLTPQDIWRNMNGIMDNKKTPTPKQLREVCNSIDKMRLTILRIDISEEIKAGYIKIKDVPVINGVFEGYFLPADKVSFRTEKGAKLNGYCFYDIPSLYYYNCDKGHVLLVNYSLLDTSDCTGNEGNTVAFRNHLLLRIALMYRYRKLDCRILFDNVYRKTDIPPPKERLNREDYSSDHSYKTAISALEKKDRDKMSAILESWVMKDWITGYELVKEGREYIGFDIQLNPNNFKVQIKETSSDTS